MSRSRKAAERCGVGEQGCLLSIYTGKTGVEVRIPPSPTISWVIPVTIGNIILINAIAP